MKKLYNFDSHIYGLSVMFEEYLFASIVIATCTSYLFLCKKSGPHRQLQKGNTTKSNDKSKDDIKGTPSPTKKSPSKVFSVTVLYV